MTDKTNELKQIAKETALLELCGLENIDDLSGSAIHYTRKVVDGMFDAGYDHAAAELRWIPIRSADDLPKENGYYLVTCGSVGIDPDDTTSHELNWFGGKWYLPSDEMIEMDGVIAWMKKPKPYTEPADNIGEAVEGKNRTKKLLDQIRTARQISGDDLNTIVR